ncbi:MAG: ribonuclease P protein component [Candidatus Moraniibacteriota bacterium]
MLKKGLRLKTNEDFSRVFRQGKPLFFGAIACKIAKNDLGFIRLGFSLSKKHLEKAVSRNRVRRALSEAFAQHLGKEFSAYQRDVVFFTVKKPQKGEVNDFASIAKNVVEYIKSDFK